MKIQNHLFAVLLTATIGLAIALPSQGQVTPTAITSVTTPAVIPADFTTNVLSEFTLTQNTGVALACAFAASAGTSNIVTTIQASVDGTNYATAAFATLTVAANTTTLVRTATNWGKDELAGYRKLRIATIQNTHGTATVTNRGIVWSKQY